MAIPEPTTRSSYATAGRLVHVNSNLRRSSIAVRAALNICAKRLAQTSQDHAHGASKVPSREVHSSSGDHRNKKPQNFIEGLFHSSGPFASASSSWKGDRGGLAGCAGCAGCGLGGSRLGPGHCEGNNSRTPSV